MGSPLSNMDNQDIINSLADVEVLKIKNEDIEIKLESYNEINLQPKGTIFGTKVKVDGEDSALSLTFDTKKLIKPKKDIDINGIMDDAIQEYLNQTDGN